MSQHLFAREIKKVVDRRTFNKLAGMTAIGALTTAELGAATNGYASEVVLEDEKLLAAFDSGSGALTRLLFKSTGWTIERRPALGVSFRLLAPLPNRRDNFVFGQKQRAVCVEKISANQVRLQWKDLLSEHGGVLPVSFTATVTLKDGVLTFDSALDNDSSLWVETIDYPYFGDLNPPSRDSTVTARIARYDNLQSDEIYPHFANEKGYWGVDFPSKTLDSCYSLFCLIQSASQGLYVEMHDPTAPYLLQYTFEQHPGVLQSIENDVPDDDQVAGIPVHLEFRTCHFVFAHPHTAVTLVPVVICAYSGDWHAGIDLYKQWRAKWYKPTPVPAWVNDIHSWQQLQINSPEEEYRVRYTDLVKYGEECLKQGVSAIQLVGWNHGGQDRGNPSQDTDPGLGTWQELRDAIAQIQAMGVKIIPFAKFPWADITTDWYKKELYKYATIDPYGIPYQTSGDSYHTPTQLAGINNRRFAVMDIASPVYQSIASKEFQKLLELGAAGWLYDEVCDCAIGKYNFAPGHGYTPPRYIYAGQLPMARQFRAAADKVNPEFLLAGEGPQDWLTQYYRLSYFRGSPTPVERYIDPNAPMMVAATGFDDREQLNRILRERYIISYEPYNFKGRLSDFPLTLEYGKKIDALRRKYRAWIWDAEFRDTMGASVTSDGNHSYSVFVARSGKRAVVVSNEESEKTLTVKVELPSPGSLMVATPEDLTAQPISGVLQIPARSAAVVMES
jgi:hypothetical protein